MSREVAIGIQGFEKIISKNYFYIDKTNLIKEWWTKGDDVTLITRPRRFGKTLNMDMMNTFFNITYKEKGYLFEGLEISKDPEIMSIQGTYPVIYVSFANVKPTNINDLMLQIQNMLIKLFEKYEYLLDSNNLSYTNNRIFRKYLEEMPMQNLYDSINSLSACLEQHHKNKVLIFLDEYDTPLQEAYLYGYYDKAAEFFRSFFNSSFKTNPSMERAIMTGITRVSKESMFSDLNNLAISSVMSEMYSGYFGFSQEEIDGALKEYNMSDQRELLKDWYDGFTFGDTTDIYNPWSFINFLKYKKFDSYWANTSSNRLASKLIQEGNETLKKDMELLLHEDIIETEIDEEIVFSNLKQGDRAVWSLLLASGYVKTVRWLNRSISGKNRYEIKAVNHETLELFYSIVQNWFSYSETSYNHFIACLLKNDVEGMNRFFSKISESTFSYFDISGKEPEKFYHGFVLGLVSTLENYNIRSNRESGFGRYDVMLIPKELNQNAYIIEFKVLDSYNGEKELAETLQNALRQIEDKKYDTELISIGISKEKIHKYGFVFKGKEVLIGK